jgi:hypothetical protein
LPIGYSAADAAIVVTAATAATPLIIQVERCIEKLLFFFRKFGVKRRSTPDAIRRKC